MLNNWPNPPIERFFSLFLGWGVGGVGGVGSGLCYMLRLDRGELGLDEI
jgi:hypothetical protein